jgi:hypothetical protein
VFDAALERELRGMGWEDEENADADDLLKSLAAMEDDSAGDSAAKVAASNPAAAAALAGLGSGTKGWEDELTEGDMEDDELNAEFAALAVEEQTAQQVPPGKSDAPSGAEEVLVELGEDDDEDLEGLTLEETEWPRAVEHLVSLAVLERTQSNFESRIASGKLGEDEREEATMELGSVKLKIQLLMNRVQNGELSQDAYVAEVTARIARDRKLADWLRKHGRGADATEVAKRVEVAERELRGEEEEDPKQGQAGIEPETAQAARMSMASATSSPPVPKEVMQKGVEAMRERLEAYKTAADRWVRSGSWHAGERARALLLAAREVKVAIEKAEAWEIGSVEAWRQLLKSLPKRVDTEVLMGLPEEKRKEALKSTRERVEKQKLAFREHALFRQKSACSLNASFCFSTRSRVLLSASFLFSSGSPINTSVSTLFGSDFKSWRQASTEPISQASAFSMATFTSRAARRSARARSPACQDPERTQRSAAVLYASSRSRIASTPFCITSFGTGGEDVAEAIDIRAA